MLKKLVALVRQLEQNPDLPDDLFKYLTDTPASELPPEVALIVEEAMRVLVPTHGAGPSISVRRQLIDYGVLVSPCDEDNGKWLSSVINTKKGMIVFGYYATT